MSDKAERAVDKIIDWRRTRATASSAKPLASAPASAGQPKADCGSGHIPEDVGEAYRKFVLTKCLGMDEKDYKIVKEVEEFNLGIDEDDYDENLMVVLKKQGWSIEKLYEGLMSFRSFLLWGMGIVGLIAVAALIVAFIPDSRPLPATDDADRYYIAPGANRMFMKIDRKTGRTWKSFAGHPWIEIQER